MHSFNQNYLELTLPLPDALLSCFFDFEDVIEEWFVLFKCSEALDLQMFILRLKFWKKEHWNRCQVQVLLGTLNI